MAHIRMLSENVIGKIAAGEVVERPAAAIKELVENSLDAGATSVLVEIREGGIESFRVSDNGCGIAPSDIRLAFERHATSKIREAEDLDAIGTLGFRGEALASIAAVGKVTLVSRTAEEETGLRVQNEGGRILSIQEAACAVGTTITVKDLFFNVPVRKGFLKKPITEANTVTDLMMRLILSRPDVNFRYLSNGRMIYHSPGDGKIASAVLSIYGSRAVRSMREIRGHSGGVLVRGYVGIGENARSSRSNESFFINGRMLRSPLLSGALEDACRERVMIGKYPICSLYLDMAPESVNVNVHPNKMEVRFRDDQAVRQAVFLAVFDALQDRDAFERPIEMPLFTEKEQEAQLEPIPPKQDAGARVEITDKIPEATEEVSRPEPVFRAVSVPAQREEAAPAAPIPRAQPSAALPLRESGPVAAAHVLREAEAAQEMLPPPAVSHHTTWQEPIRNAEQERAKDETGASAADETGIVAEQLSVLKDPEKKPIKIFGALFDTYILIEYADHLLLVDQHAVHERLLFDRMMKAYEGQQAGQEMLLPVIVSLTRRELALLEEYRELLSGIGLVTEPFGEQEVAIRSVPMMLGENETEAFLREAIVELENGKTPGADKKRAAILQMACKHAVKGGEPLSEEDLRYLVEEMIDRKVTPTCPHGRPLVVSISHLELDKKFKRIQ